MNSREFYNDIIAKYKEILKIDSYLYERYKWDLLKEFGGKPNTDAINFGEEVISVKYQNLIFENASAAMKHICSLKSEDYRQALKILFDESKSINDRVAKCLKDLDQIYGEIASDPSHKHHHGEREFATLLTFKYPEKYLLYKNSFYQKICKNLSVSAAQAGEKYGHYLSLVNDFIKNEIKKDDELLEMYKNLKPQDSFTDPNYTLLAQDILYRVLDLYWDKKELDLTEFDLYKLSMGSFNQQEFENIILKGRVAVHQDTKAKGRGLVSQAEEFQNAPQGSFFILNHGNGVGKIKLIGRFSKDNVIEKKDGWLERDFETIARAICSDVYQSDDKWWTPNNNSTFIKIPKSELDLAKKLILNKYFNISIKALSPSLSQSTKEQFEFPHVKNLILYGPPGTGKTYATKEKAVSIINEPKS